VTAIPSAPDDFAHSLAGQYAIRREVGRGGMGVVYLARDLKLDRDVAIKTLPPQLASDPVIRERFLREARTAAALSHPNIVPIHRADEMGGQVFFVMGYVDGAPLSQIIREGGPMSPRTAVAVLHDVAKALGYAHGMGVVHRDVKAENILIERSTGRALVTDFGIARLAEASPLTATGTVLGTVYYMSPEQVAGDAVDARSDIYSLGVVAFYALSGHFPFENPSASAVLVAHVTKIAPAIASIAPTVPGALADVVDRCLNKDPAARFQSCDELLDALERAEALLPEHDVAAPPPGGVPGIVSPTEAQDIWREAAELQERTGALPALKVPSADDVNRKRRAAPVTSGYQLAEVRAAAKEVGIDDAFVDRVLIEHGLAPTTAQATEVRNTITRKPNMLLGRHANIAFETVVPGEMSERDFDIMVDTIRRTLNDAGMVSGLGRSMTWVTADKQRKVQITVLVRDGRTSIQVNERLRDLIGALFGGIMGGGAGATIGPGIGIAVNVLHAPLLAFPMVTLGVGLTYGTARAIFNHIAKKRTNVLRELTEKLAEQARESIARRGVGGVPTQRKLGR
jgi:serine/threonine-protein kinase